MLFLLSLLVCFQMIEAGPTNLIKTNPSLYLSNEIWEQVQDYLISDDHPMKEKLDRIFSNSRVLADQGSFLAAGFTSANLQHCTQIIVSTHPELPGYIVKAYLDSFSDPKNRPEQYFLMKRVMGARLTHQCIKAHNYEHLFKVPEKWIYLLPDPPSYLRDRSCRMFILIEQDMDIFTDKENEKLWGSKVVTKELLDALFIVTTEVGLGDSTKPSNCPFSKDGKVAFIDTQMFGVPKMKYNKLTSYLSPSKKAYWKKLIRNNE